MLLVVAIPDQARLNAETTANWSLLDGAGTLLRAGSATLANMPRPERVIVTVPAGRIVFIETPLPRVGAAKREALLRYAIEDKLTIDPATIHAAVLGTVHEAASGAGDTTRHIVAAIDRPWFAGALAWLAQADLSPAAAFAETDAVAVAPGEWAVVIAGASGYARRDDGYAYALDTAERDAPPFALRLALGEVAAPAQRITLYTMHGAGDAAPAPDPGLAARWQAALEIPLRDGGELSAAGIGKRLMQLKTGNLLTQEFTPRRAAAAWAARLRPALIAVALLAGAQLLLTVADWWRLERQRRALDGEMHATFKGAFPQARAIVDAPLQMQRNLDRLKRERGLVRDDDARIALAQFAELTRAVPQLSISEVAVRSGPDGNVATLRGTLAEAAAAETLRQQLKRLPGADLVLGAVRDGASAPPVEISLKVRP